MVGADKARRGAGGVLGTDRKAMPIGDHEVEVADTRRVEPRIVDLAQAAAFQSKPHLAQCGVTRAEAIFVCRQPIGLAARTAGRHALSLDWLLTNVDHRAGYKRKLQYFPFQRLPLLSYLRTAPPNCQEPVRKVLLITQVLVRSHQRIKLWAHLCRSRPAHC
jgi:hypothetical protein